MRIAIWSIGKKEEYTVMKEHLKRLLLHDLQLLVLNNCQSTFPARLPCQEIEKLFPQKTILHLNDDESWIETNLSERKMTILAIQMLNLTQAELNEGFGQILLNYMKEKSAERVIVVGNLRIDPGNFSTTFEYKQYFQNIAVQGWVDAWRYLHPVTYEYLWFSNAKRGLFFSFIILAPVMKEFLLNAYRCSVVPCKQKVNQALIVELDEFS